MANVVVAGASSTAPFQVTMPDTASLFQATTPGTAPEHPTFIK